MLNSSINYRTQYHKEESSAIKATSNACCSNGFGDWKRNIATNTAKVMNMIETGAICQINMLSEIEIAIKCNPYSVWWFDAMTKDVRREETSKFLALSGRNCNNEICLVCILDLGLLFVIQPEISLKQSPTSCVRERSAVDKDIYNWVPSAYNSWYNLWLWII